MTLTMKDIQPCKEAFDKARVLGLEAAKDSHFQPCPEEHVNEDTVDDVGAISEEHKDSWCETTHFQILYGNRISDLTDQEEERITGEIGGLSHVDLGRYEGLYIPLRDAFFDAWEVATDFYPKANAAMAKYRADKSR